ncbi:MAG: type III-B CRISPR module RAMP protein Cmr4 [Kiritimatiellae bacterium]|nr:type III-B CRISPR module RAMP protein Cmr4 [Kiritimatiellia bacterium]
MNTKLLTIFTRTPLHVGCGSSVGAVDQPVARERHTRFPIIPGSAIKGVLADLWEDEKEEKTNKKGEKVLVRCKDARIYFGSDDMDDAESGKIAFGEARLLAFPVRSAKGCFAFITSPLSLERYKRDAGLGDDFKIPELKDGQTCLAGSEVTFTDRKAVVLEEYRFEKTGDFPADWAEKLCALADDAVLNGGKDRFVLVHDEDMSFFAENACQISQHVSIDSKTGAAAEGKLFNQEEVPSETLFYAPLTELSAKVNYKPFMDRIGTSPLVQFGGKGTSGIGYCSVKLV